MATGDPYCVIHGQLPCKCMESGGPVLGNIKFRPYTDPQPAMFSGGALLGRHDVAGAGEVKRKPDIHDVTTWAWLQTGGRAISLHYCHGVTHDDWEEISDGGKVLTTACGKRLEMRIPGVLSRMFSPRCRSCCKALGIPQGYGTPWNANLEDAMREAIEKGLAK